MPTAAWPGLRNWYFCRVAFVVRRGHAHQQRRPIDPSPEDPMNCFRRQARSTVVQPPPRDRRISGPKLPGGLLAMALLLFSAAASASGPVFDMHVHLREGEASLRAYQAEVPGAGIEP